VYVYSGEPPDELAGRVPRAPARPPNPYVELHLNSDAVGDDVVRVSGYATIPKSRPPAHREPAYIRKYRGQIEGLGMTVEGFAEQYQYPTASAVFAFISLLI
jgi:hypothetical protein